MKKNKIQELEYNVSAYWWNCGKKTKDFTGNLGDFLIKKGIKYRKIKHPREEAQHGYKFTINSRISFISYSDFFDAAFSAIKLHYAYMGDKATVNIIGREFTINH